MHTGYNRRKRRFLSRTYNVHNLKRSFYAIIFIICMFMSILLFSSATHKTSLFTNTNILTACLRLVFPMLPDNFSIVLPNKYDIINSVFPVISSNDAMAKKYAAKWDMSIRAKRSDKKNSEIKEKTEQINNIKVQTLSMAAKGLTYNNATEYAVDANTLLNAPLNFVSKNNEPRVLIVHTHTSEAYSDSPGGRSTDDSQNVVRIGKEIADSLNRAGIKTIHDTTKNDQPDYNGSYKNALSVIQKNLLKYPSLEIVLDVHRDYTVRDSGKPTELHLKPTQTENGKDAAQIMFVIGTDAMDLHHTDWRHNLSFATKIQSRLDEIHPNLCRPINVRTERFNQHMTKGSMIIEVGSSTNTLNEAIRAGGYIAEAISDVLNKKR